MKRCTFRRSLAVASGIVVALSAGAETWTFDARTRRMTAPDGTNVAWTTAGKMKLRPKGTLVIGGEGAPVELTGTTDWRHIFRGVGGVTALEFGAEAGPCFKEDCYLQSLYAGFPGAGNVTSITSRVRTPMAWSMPARWSEGLHCRLFQDCGKLREVRLAGFLTKATALPKLKSGQCRIVVPANHPHWTAFAFAKGNLRAWPTLSDAERADYANRFGAKAATPYGLTAATNAIGLAAGYWLVPQERFALDLNLESAVRRGGDAASTWSLYALAPAPAADGTYAAGTEVAVTVKATNGVEKTVTATMNADTRVAPILAALLAAEAREQANVNELVVDPDAKPIRDVRESSAFPILGYAGSLVGEGQFSKYFFVDDRERTARVFREAGVRLVRQWDAIAQWQCGAGCGRGWRKQPGFNYEEYRCDMKEVFSFYREQGIKAMLTLENYSVYTNAYLGLKTGDLAVVKQVTCDYVKWILDNGFKDCVAGFELGNEAYWQGASMFEKKKDSPEWYAARCAEIIDGIVKIWPDAPIGIPLAEYMKGDPDVKAVRSRMLAMNKVVSKGYFDESALNQWSGRYVIALSNSLRHVTHVIYHSYGGAIPESCSYCGISRFRGFTKAFPELAGKKFWITEWRERSDEDNRSHQHFDNALFKGAYMMMMVAQDDVDALNLHEFSTLSGGLYMSGLAPESAPRWHNHTRNARWQTQWNSADKERPNWSNVGSPQLECGIAGPVFRLLNEGIRLHPVLLALRAERSGYANTNATSAVWCGSQYYGTKRPDVLTLTARDEKKDEAVVMALNFYREERKIPIRAAAKWKFSAPDVRVYCCPTERLSDSELPGEGRYTRQYGYEQRKGGVDPLVVTLPANSLVTITIPLRRAR